jgi:phosphatidylglycerol:prolipoprotein diacylglycerol transferase
MLPYLEPPVLRLGPLEVPPFPALVLIGALVGFELVVRRAEAVGLDRAWAARAGGWTLLGGFVGSHLVSELAYFPAAVAAQPSRLLWVWGSMSSLGGMAGGILAALLVGFRARMSPAQTLPFLDLLAFAAPFGWAFGRLGCALAHDHLGVASEHWLAVRFPDGGRFDLGLLELGLMAGLALLFAGLARSPRPAGFYLGLFFTIYGPARFLLDTLRVGEIRYLGWTPGQYASLAAALSGAAVLCAVLSPSRWRATRSSALRRTLR